MLGLRCCMQALVVASGGYSLVTMWGLLSAIASSVAEHALGCVDFSHCGTWLWFLGSSTQAQQLGHTDLVVHGMWNTSRPGIRPMSPALAGKFFITEPSGKPQELTIFCVKHKVSYHSFPQWGRSPRSRMCLDHPAPPPPNSARKGSSRLSSEPWLRPL